MSSEKQSKKVWATLVTKPDYVPGLLTVNYTLRAVSSYPLLVMATSTLPESSRQIIQNQGMQVIDVEHLSPSQEQHPGFDPSFARFNDAWTKLRVFGLEGYDRVVLIDSDMIFTRSMDEVFDLELPGDDWIGAAPACVCNPFNIAHYPKDWIPANCALSKQSPTSTLLSPAIPDPTGPRTSHLLNSGMVVLQPRKQTMDHIIHFLNTSPTVAEAKFADQDVIAEAFRGRWRPLPWWTNALKTERAVHPGVWDDKEVRLIHYILEKPWNERPAAAKRYETDIPADGPEINGVKSLPPALLELVRNSPPQQDLVNYDEVHTWWWVAYEAMLADLKAQGESSGWKEIEASVKR